MNTECKHHIYAYILGIITGVAILFLFYVVYGTVYETNETVKKIYSILDVNSTCENK